MPTEKLDPEAGDSKADGSPGPEAELPEPDALNSLESRQSMASTAPYKTRRETEKKVS